MTRKDWEFYADPSCAAAWRTRETGVSYWNRTLCLLIYGYCGKSNGGGSGSFKVTIFRNIVAVVVGSAVAAAVNMTIVIVGPMIVPPPAGVDVTAMESIRTSIHLFELKHFVAPFLAHAAGTLAGAFVAYLIAASHRQMISFIIGGVFLAGGIAAAFTIPAPGWFITVDLVAAYIPMAWIGIWLGERALGKESM